MSFPVQNPIVSRLPKPFIGGVASFDPWEEAFKLLGADEQKHLCKPDASLVDILKASSAPPMEVKQDLLPWLAQNVA